MNAMPLIMFAVVCGVLLLGYPVAFSLGGTALLFAAAGIATGAFDDALLSALPSRLYGVMTNQTLIAVPLFILMGIVLEKSKVAEALLETMAEAFGRIRGGLGLSVIVVGMLLAASTGIVGATVVTMGVISLPTMMRRNYNPSFAAGTICATGTLGQIIPPSIALVLLGDVLSTAYQEAQLQMGVFSPKTVSVGDLFAGALLPGLLLVLLYGTFVVVVASVWPQAAPPTPKHGDGHTPDLGRRVVKAIFPAAILIVSVLGSILLGIATPTEGAGVGAMGAVILGFSGGKLSGSVLKEALTQTTKVTSMVFMILVGATAFSLVFRGYGGDEVVRGIFEESHLGKAGLFFTTMLVIFLLGFILDFIEITFVVVPIVGPLLLRMGFDPVWLGVMLAVNLQTSFLTPPFGFSLFYLRGVAPATLKTSEIYRGVVPFVALQLLVIAILFVFPELATTLPQVLYGN